MDQLQTSLSVPSGLARIQEDYLLPLDEEGADLYREMRKAEIEWIEATGFRAHGFSGRTCILIATHSELPDIACLRETREAFAEWAHTEAGRLGKPLSIGSRSTAMPVWLSSAGKIPVDAGSLPWEAVEKITWRIQEAYRSAVLGPNEVRQIFGKRKKAKARAIETYSKSGHRTRAEEAKAAHEKILLDEIAAERIFGQHGTQVSARLLTGSATKFLFKTKSERWTDSIANVGLVMGSRKTKVEPARQTRRKKGKLIEIARIEPFVFFVSAT